MHRDFLPALTSASAYPSIETYHAIGERGRLTEERNVVFDGDVFITEKIDGTNSRIILEPLDAGIGPLCGWLIGSRKELLTANGDLVYNPAEGIVERLRDIPPSLQGLRRAEDVVVVYGEVYGGKQSASKQYTSRGEFGYRVFDIATFPAEKLHESRESLASWRDHGGQSFAPVDLLQRAAHIWDLDLVPYVTAPPPPESIEGTYNWLQAYAQKSAATLDPAAQGRAEGVVVRSADRSRIAKIRFEDYRRTLRQSPVRRSSGPAHQ